MMSSYLKIVVFKVLAVTRTGKLGNCAFSANIKFHAEEKLEFTTKFVILPNACWTMFSIY